MIVKDSQRVKEFIQILLQIASGIRPPVNRDRLGQCLDYLLQPTSRHIHQLIPVVAHELEKFLEPKLLDNEKVTQLVQVALIMERQWQSCLDWFHGFVKNYLPDSIDVILLKGVALAGQVYENPNLRVGADIDFLVREQDAKFVGETLCQLGEMKQYPPHRPFSGRKNFQTEYRIKTEDGAEVVVELHTALTHPYMFNVRFDTLWQHSVPSTFHNKENVRLLCPSHALLHIAVHAQRHCMVPPINVVDAYRLLASFKPSPDSLAQDADSWGAKTVLYALLRTVHRYLNTDVVEEYINSLKLSSVRRSLALTLLPPASVACEPQISGPIRRGVQLLLLDRVSQGGKFLGHYFFLRTMDLWMKGKQRLSAT